MNGQLNSYGERPPTLVANGQKLIGERPRILEANGQKFIGERPRTFEANGHPYKIEVFVGRLFDVAYTESQTV